MSKKFATIYLTRLNGLAEQKDIKEKYKDKQRLVLN